MTIQPYAARLATEDDVDGIAAVHVQSWHETYAGILSPTLIAKRTVEDRIQLWRQVVRRRAVTGAAVFVVEQDRHIVGFGSCGWQRSRRLKWWGFDGEFSALYVLRSVQGRGLGTALMGTMARDLLDHCIGGASLWVLKESHGARRFYEKIGGKVVAEKEETRDDEILHQVAYGWRDLTMLLSVPFCESVNS